MIYQNTEFTQTVVGVFLGGKTLLAGKIKDGKVEKKVEISIDNLAPEQEILLEVIHAINEVFDNEVEGIGVGVPSLVNVNKGIVYHVVNIPSWREVHLKEILEDRFKVNVFLNNDANCFAAGEKHFGKAQNYEHVIGLVIGVGFGCGIITNNQLYSGNNCGAGEFGSIPYRDHDYEYYCSEAYFKEKYGENFTDFVARANKKDKIALALFEQYGCDLGNAIKTIMFTTDPEIIVIGGKVAKAFPFYQKTMWDKIKTFPYKHSVKNIKIEVSTQSDISILGAAALYYDALNKI
ncbi:MAG: ROK family protein [Salinivirgaceae bacterium]|jgi:glucokinase|nr:ROK family protein [Salinivirgaceae bacterium]